MTNKRRFFQNGILLTAVGLAIRTVGIFYHATLGRVVGVEGIGLFSLITTVFSFALTFSTAGLSLTVTRLVAAAAGEGNGTRVKAVLRAAVGYACLFGGVATAVLCIFAPAIGMRALRDVRTVLPLRILAFSLVPSALATVYSGYFVGMRRVTKNAVTQVAGQVAKILLLLLFVARMGRGNVSLAILTLAVSSLLTDLICFVICALQFVFDRHKYAPVYQNTLDKSPRSAAAEVYGMALPLAFSSYVRSALLTLEHVLIPHCLRLGGATQAQSLAAYGLLHGMAVPMVLYPMVTLSSFSGLLVPEFAEAHTKKDGAYMSRLTARALHTTLVYAVATSVFLFLFAEEVGYLVYDSWEAGHYIAMLSCIVPVMYLDHVTDSVLKGIGEHVYSSWVNISDSFLSVLLVWLLIPRMGIAGYAVVIIVMEAYNFLLSFLRLRRRIRFSFRPVRSLLLPLFSAAVAAGLSRSAFAMNGAQTTPFWLIAKLVFATAVFVALYLSLSMLLDASRRSRRRASSDKARL